MARPRLFTGERIGTYECLQELVFWEREMRAYFCSEKITEELDKCNYSVFWVGPRPLQTIITWECSVAEENRTWEKLVNYLKEMYGPYDPSMEARQQLARLTQLAK